MQDPPRPARLDRIARRPLTAALVLVGLSVLARTAVVFLTPMELYPDEAQYWVWSRTPDWGYFSKPPLIAWLIGLTTLIGGNDEAWIRASMPLLHGLTALVLFEIGRRLYDGRAGLAAAAVYTLAPAVQLSSLIASTDAPLILFCSLAILAYVRLGQETRDGRRLALGALLGGALGLAFLSKYAAAYVAAGLVWHALACPAARDAWRGGAKAAAAAAFALTLGPNLIWNSEHRFVTIGHTAENAHWRWDSLFHPGELLGFVGSQAGVFGPIPFALLIGGAAVTLAGRRLRPEDRLLLILAATPLLAVSLQALLSRANANWAFAAYGPASVLVGAWLTRRRARRTALATGLTQGALAAAFAAGVVVPGLADAMGLSNSLKRARGWEAMSGEILAAAAREAVPPTAIVVDSRFLYNAMRYYGRDALDDPGVPPLRMWVREAAPKNHAEMAAPLAQAEGGRALGVSLTPDTQPEMQADFAAVEPRPPLSVSLDAKRTRDAALFVGLDFEPPRRDPATGQPVADPD